MGTRLIDDHAHPVHIALFRYKDPILIAVFGPTDLWCRIPVIVEVPSGFLVALSWGARCGHDRAAACGSQPSNTIIVDQDVALSMALILVGKNAAAHTGFKAPCTRRLSCRKRNPLSTPDSYVWVQVSTESMGLLKRTDQIESIGFWVLLQVLHDVSIFVPGEYQAEVGDSRRYPVERKDIAVLKLLHQHYFLAESLRHLSEWRTTLS